jgi:hypothetical protein
MKNSDSLWFIALWVLVALLAFYQIVDYVQFRMAGDRYTAENGLALCLRVQKLDGQPCEQGDKR